MLCWACVEVCIPGTLHSNAVDREVTSVCNSTIVSRCCCMLPTLVGMVLYVSTLNWISAALLKCKEPERQTTVIESSTVTVYTGPLMTEDSALVCVLVGGGLDVRFLSRRLRTQQLADNNQDGPVAAAADNPPPLPVPKKTKLYVEFAKRERDNASEMYNAFQQYASSFLQYCTQQHRNP